MIKNLIFLFALAFLFVACSTPGKQVNAKQVIKQNAIKHSKTVLKESYEPIITPEEYKKMLAEQVPLKVPQNINMNQALMDFYADWKGTKYRLGGNSRKGIDCSAFTQRIFKEKFDTNIPRTTRTQVKVGKEIKKSELTLGDLVFFKTGRLDRHVGVYMGDGNFMHASIKGVKFTKLNKPFYKKAYWTSRRIIY
jgi:lipoprotein Spr